jgi:hypothetical protein
MGEDNTAILGKKIFFLHPSAFIQNDVMGGLAQMEHEVYAARDEGKLAKALENYSNSIVFCCIDETLSPQKWEGWVRRIMSGEATRTVSIGILSNTNNDEVRRLYLNNLSVPCGFVSAKTEKPKLLKILADILKAAESKGRRTYIRADTRSETMTTLNISHNGSFINAAIQDISFVGLSCVFAEDPELEKNSLVTNIQIKLQSVLLKAEGIVFGSRIDDKGTKTYVLVFTPKVDPAVRVKIRIFIQKHLQSKMDAVL